MAMARWQLGEREEAKRLLDELTAWMEKNRSEDDGLRQLWNEAAELIRGSGSESR